MKPGRILKNTALAVAFAIVVGGCEPSPEEPVKTTPAPQLPVAGTVTVALKFTPHETTTYKVVTNAERSVTVEGELSKDPSMKGGKSGDSTEMVFTQEILSVDERGNAIAKITIDELKYLAKIRDNTVIDFDSARDQDKASPLAKLVGQNYTIELTPAGQVVRVIDVKEAQAAVRGASPAHKRGSQLLRPERVRERHTIAALPVTDKNRVAVGNSWSNIRAVDFHQMGAKSYERIYVLRDLKDVGAHRVAFVEMNAIPTSEMAEQLHEQESASDLTKMFDNIDTYTGHLELDLTTGKVEKYSDKLLAEWIVVDPSAQQKADAEPSALRMTAVRSQTLERIH